MSWLIKLDADLIRQVIIQAATFLVFFIIVKVFFADKLKDILKKRQEAIEKDIDDAAAAKDNAKALETQYAELMQNAKDEKAEILRIAQNDGEQLRNEIVADARTQADTMLQNARTEIDRERAQAEKDLKESVVDMAIDAAEKITGKTLTEEDQRKLIDDAILAFTEEQA